MVNIICWAEEMLVVAIDQRNLAAQVLDLCDQEFSPSTLVVTDNSFNYQIRKKFLKRFTYKPGLQVYKVYTLSQKISKTHGDQISLFLKEKLKLLWWKNTKQSMLIQLKFCKWIGLWIRLNWQFYLCSFVKVLSLLSLIFTQQIIVMVPINAFQMSHFAKTLPDHRRKIIKLHDKKRLICKILASLGCFSTVLQPKLSQLLQQYVSF